jgi:uncharacterized protein (TIGR00297 family)
MIHIFVGTAISGIVSIFAIIKGKLTLNAGLTAIAVSTLISACTGWEPVAVLITFFASASVTSRFKKRVDSDSANQARRVSQVLANSLPALLFSLIYYLTDSPDNQIFLLSSVSAIACAAADTWSSDIGVLSKLSKRKTISILTFKQIEAGQSGGISLLGCISSVLGSAFIAGICVILFRFSNAQEDISLAGFLTIVSCGIIGSLADSILGASVQAKYDYKNRIIEEKENHMENVKLVSGFRIINNDAVNLLSGFIAGGISIIISAFTIAI